MFHIIHMEPPRATTARDDRVHRAGDDDRRRLHDLQRRRVRDSLFVLPYRTAAERRDA
jgi:hypothetical protein